jgi:hypothetical protein
MSRKITRQTGSYEAANAAGKRYTIHVFTEFLDAGNLDSASWIPGMQSHKLASGGHVNVNADGTLEIVETGEVLRRV